MEDHIPAFYMYTNEVGIRTCFRYLKELDYYEKCLVDIQREKSTRMNVRRGSDDTDRGCLGFCGRTRRKFLKCDSPPIQHKSSLQP